MREREEREREGESRGGGERKKEREREKIEGAVTLALKMERATNQGMQAALAAEKLKKTGSPVEPAE